MRIYLDTCCLGRLFDDPGQTRVAEEAAAVSRVFGLVASGLLELVSSEMVEEEVSRISQAERRADAEFRLARAAHRVTMSTTVSARGLSLVRLGFHQVDALHLAAAEDAEAECFLSTDDRLVRRAARFRRELGVRVLNPTLFIAELNDGQS